MSKWGRGRVAAFLASAAWLLAAPVGAQAATFSSDPSATSLGREIATDSSLVVGASYVAKPPVGGSAAIGEGEIAGLPTHGPKFGVLSTGRAAIAGNANSSESSGQSLNGPNVRGNTDYDVTILKIDVDVPQTANCLMGLDFRFASEEYAEWVGSGFNDAFVAEVDQSTWTTNGSTINAPRNFAFDPTGAPISINAAGVTSMRREFAAGTTYDGATPLLTAATPIQPGRHSIYLSIFDQGDRIYDSAVFLDNLRVGRVADVQRDCKPGADLADDRRYYALGDSYSSGFGVSPYEPGTNGDAGPNDCQRSTRAYSQLVASDLGLDLSFHACQGAVTRDFYEPRNSTWGELAQLEYLKPDAGLVTYGIGGNDAGFADAIRDCIDGWELLPWNTCHEDERVAEPVQEAIERLDNRRATPAEIRPYDRINKDVRQRTPFATRVAVGYPPLFPAEGGDRTFLPGGRCEAVKKADQRWMVEKTLELNGIIERNALRNGFKYADPVSRFQGHELCSGGDEWFYGLLSGGRFHPTAEGHRAVADAILEAIPLDERPGRTVQQGQTEFYSFFVDPLEALLSIISEWPGSDVEMTLVSPTGKRYTRANPGEGVYHDNGPTWEHFEIPSPEAGAWTVELYGADVDPGGELTKLSIHAEGPPNQRPEAKIDLRREGDRLVLDGRGSRDPDGTIEGHDWYVATAAGERVLQGAEVSIPVGEEPEAITLVVTDDKGLTDFAAVSTTPIDIKPDSTENPFNLGARGRIPVALLSSEPFDATTVDATTLRFGPNRAAPVHVAREDANGDGRTDLLVHFARQDVGAVQTTRQLCMTGTLPDERGFLACDSVTIVP
jgi:hypothetical protein